MKADAYKFQEAEFNKWKKGTTYRRLAKRAKVEKWSLQYKQYREYVTFANYLKRKLEKAGLTKSDAYKSLKSDIKMLYPKKDYKSLPYLPPTAETKVIKTHSKIAVSFLNMQTSTVGGVKMRYENIMKKLQERYNEPRDEDVKSYFDNLNPDDIVNLFEAINDYSTVESYGSEDLLTDVSNYIDEYDKDTVISAVKYASDKISNLVKHRNEMVKNKSWDKTLSSVATNDIVAKFKEDLQKFLSRKGE